MRKLSATLLSTVLLSALLTACGGGSSNYDFDKSVEVVESALPHGPIFDPAAKKFPTLGAGLLPANDLILNPVDGTLDIPNDANGDGIPDNPVVHAMNQLDGFSTTNPIVLDFGMSIDASSLVIGDSVRVFKVTKSEALVDSVDRELSNAEVVALPQPNNKLAIIPLVPLKGSTSYMVLLTKGIKDTVGKPADAPSAYFFAKGDASLIGDFKDLEPIRILVNNMETKAIEFVQSTGSVLDKDTIIMSWTLTTQSISAVLDATPTPVGNISMAIFPGVNSPQGAANVYTGTLEVPYYLDKAKPLTGFWRNSKGNSPTWIDPTPVETTKLTIPVMMTMPIGAVPNGGWPIVIYQHGITRVRTDVLAYADAMAAAGFAVIAIDLPLHGVDPENPLYSVFHTDIEPFFGLEVDGSGAHFMNLGSLLTSRDNIRQGVSNLLVLRKSLSGIQDINSDKVGFVAHSLGGIVGVPFIGIESKKLPSSLVTTGAPIRPIIRDSIPFGDDIRDGLAAAGIVGAQYEGFLYAAQYVLDSADPINYAVDAVNTHPIHIVEVIGDKVVPNVTTEQLAKLMGATDVSATVNNIAVSSPGIVRFTQGNHSSVLDPTRGGDFLNVFVEIHTQLATFQATGGTTILISDDSIIKK